MLNVNYRVLICCTCHFQSGSLLFILASSVCKSLQCLISALTQGGEGCHLFRLTCSAVLWGGRDTVNKYRWHVWGVFPVNGPHWICPILWWHALSGSTLLRLQVALQGHCPKQAQHFVHFQGLSCSGSGPRVLRKGTDLVGLVFCPFPMSEQLKLTSAWQAPCPKWTMHLNRLPSSGHLVSRVRRESTLRCAMCLFRGAHLRP